VSKDIEFIDAQLAYSRGDRRKLEEFMSRHGLTAEQGAFVAAAWRGDVPQADGRRFKPVSEKMADSFRTLRRWFDLLDEAANRPRTPDRVIHEMLANKYGFADPANVRRTLGRRVKDTKKK
jgi:hypothetical protein